MNIRLHEKYIIVHIL